MGKTVGSPVIYKPGLLGAGGGGNLLSAARDRAQRALDGIVSRAENAKSLTAQL